MTARVLAVVCLMILAACDGAPAVPTPSATIPDVTVYLAQARCPDGSPPLGCAGAAPQRASDPMLWRRRDWPLPGYQISDSVAAPGYFVTTWSYPPFGPFAAANGDGGEVYVVDGGKVRICCTQDGGKPGVIQRFANWWLLDDRTPSGAWRQGDKLGRARRETVTFPASGYGLTEIAADTIVSEHYDRQNLGGKMERFYLAAGWGRLLWQAWSPPNPLFPPASDLAARCPGVSWDGPPPEHPDWILQDCRLSTNLVPADGSMSVDAYGWPPPGFAP